MQGLSEGWPHWMCEQCMCLVELCVLFISAFHVNRLEQPHSLHWCAFTYIKHGCGVISPIFDTFTVLSPENDL